MAPTKFYCSQCHARLKLPPGLRAGARPKCPHCGTPIALEGANGAVAAGMPPHRSTAIAAGSAKTTTAALHEGNGQSSSQSTSGSGVGTVLAIGLVAIGGILAIVVAAVLLIVCFSGDSSKPSVVTATIDDDGPPPLGGGPPKKIAPKTKLVTNNLIVVSPEDEVKANNAVQRGIEFLKQSQKKDDPDAGSWFETHTSVGMTALVGLTLLESKVPATDPAVQAAAKFVRKGFSQQMEGQQANYAITTTMLFLTRLDDPADRPLIESLALRLVANQYPSGSWFYGSNPLTKQQEAKLREMLKDFPNYAGRGADPKVFGLLTMGVFQIQKENDRAFYLKDGDNSNTQFALLALWAARKYFPGNELDPALKLVAKRFRNTQEDDGTWTYQPNHHASAFPTMTAAGLLGIAAGYGLDDDKKAARDMTNDKVLQKGLKALATHVGNPGDHLIDPPEMYFLWSVERVAILFQLARIDGKDWYHWGLEVLVANQLKDGKWDTKRGPGQSDIVDTCFALLFLQRANLAKDLTDKIQALAAALGQAQRKD
ncbi:MAG TPA: prenyltransferase/squalene oxidase repeat-containing protein [Gemmataceae bacterium]|nr:prenyltransferase/squalene oxidase repeat-containing protein [Gemmataceae bacterium]